MYIHILIHTNTKHMCISIISYMYREREREILGEEERGHEQGEDEDDAAPRAGILVRDSIGHSDGDGINL